MKEYVELTLLLDIFGDDAEWKANVTASGVAHGWHANPNDDGWYEITNLKENELELTHDVEYYDFMGSAYEQERFYIRAIDIFKHKTTGKLYVEYSDELDTF